jgi:hypothetical protein
VKRLKPRPRLDELDPAFADLLTGQNSARVRGFLIYPQPGAGLGVPALYGPYYLSLRENGNKNPAAGAKISLFLHLEGDQRPLVTVPQVNEWPIAAEWRHQAGEVVERNCNSALQPHWLPPHN